MAGKLLSIFKQIEDNRRDLSKLHDLNDILVMAIIAVICGQIPGIILRDIVKPKRNGWPDSSI